MTPDELLRAVEGLVSSNRHREALELTSTNLRELAPSMTPQQIVQVADLAHIAQMAVDLEAWDGAEADDAPEMQRPTKLQSAAQAPPAHRP